MINQGNNVPDKTIAVFTWPDYWNIGFEDIMNVVEKPSKKRDWFTPNFYNCLPLTIGNQQGFIVKAPCDFSVIWNGKNDNDGNNTQINIIGNPDWNMYHNSTGPNGETLLPGLGQNFGHGIITLHMPVCFRTPPGVNLLTMAPPNYIMDGLTVMTGVVETDNLRQFFTFNIKINQPNTLISIDKGTPLAAFIPVPRYFTDGFELVDATKIFDDETYVEEMQAYVDSCIKRDVTNTENKKRNGYTIPEKDYFKGIDVYGNKFPDHQKP